MRRGLKIGLLVVSHLGVFGVTAVKVAGHLLGAPFRDALEQPVFRLGLHMQGHGTDDSRPRTRFEDDLRAAASDLRAPAPDVLRLIHYLQHAQLNQAAEVCRRLAWPNCEPQTLARMQGELQ